MIEVQICSSYWRGGWGDEKLSLEVSGIFLICPTWLHTDQLGKRVWIELLESVYMSPLFKFEIHGVWILAAHFVEAL